MREILEPPRTSVDAFKLLFNIENALREFIVKEMTRRCGQKWHKGRLPSDVLAKYTAARQYERRTKWLSFIPHHPIYYIDFPDLKKILEQNNNWNDVFSATFVHKNITVESLFSIEPLRNAIAHNRMLSEADLHQLHASYQRLQNLIGIEEFEILLRYTSHYFSLPDELRRLNDELLFSTKCIENLAPITETPQLDKCSSSWWFDCDYLGHPVDQVEACHQEFRQYMRLPRGWGAGLDLERWAQRPELLVTLKAARDQIASLVREARGAAS
jgi:hypothetical protein